MVLFRFKGEFLSDITGRTPFGVDRHGYGYGQPVNHPLSQASVDQIHDYPWPDSNGVDISNLRTEASRYHGEYAILGGDWSPFWHDAIDLFGMEDLMIAMYDNPERVDALLDHIADYYIGGSTRIFEEAADLLDIFFIGNDFGSQTGPLLIDDTPAQVWEKTREILSIMQPGGGYIVSASHDYILEETPVENVLAMFDAAINQS